MSASENPRSETEPTEVPIVVTTGGWRIVLDSTIADLDRYIESFERTVAALKVDRDKLAAVRDAQG